MSNVLCKEPNSLFVVAWQLSKAAVRIYYV